jgi:hypothetical protein
VEAAPTRRNWLYRNVRFSQKKGQKKNRHRAGDSAAELSQKSAGDCVKGASHPPSNAALQSCSTSLTDGSVHFATFKALVRDCNGSASTTREIKPSKHSSSPLYIHIPPPHYPMHPCTRQKHNPAPNGRFYSAEQAGT